jgi:hypothetical protein
VCRYVVGKNGIYFACASVFVNTAFNFLLVQQSRRCLPKNKLVNNDRSIYDSLVGGPFLDGHKDIWLKP